MSGFKVIRSEDTELISYGPKSDLRVLIGDDAGSTTIRTALQTCKKGYDVPIHCHPYIEYLIVLQGAAEFRIEDNGTQTVVLKKGDSVELRPDVWHAFSAVSDEDTLLMGIHLSRRRIVNYKEEVKTDARGFRVQS